MSDPHPRPTTPPAQPPQNASTNPPQNPLTPEQVRRIEESRLRAKALRTQRDADAARSGQQADKRTPSGFVVPPTAGQKRPAASLYGSEMPGRELRDARTGGAGGGQGQSGGQGGSGGAGGQGLGKKDTGIETARKFNKYIDYDFSKMTDTHGGFLSADDDPHNRALHAPDPKDPGAQKPAHMSVREWERLQLVRKLQRQKAGPFEPGISGLDEGGPHGGAKKERGCVECGSLEIDFQWAEVFDVRVCNRCKEEKPERYSLLTKTEAKEDYLLTDPELRDEELLRRLEKPNPHKKEWNNMYLFLRFQVEEYAFSERKWGSPERLDEEFEKRQVVKKKRKEDKFRSKLEELKKRTRVEAYRRDREAQRAGGDREAQFGDSIGGKGGHEHEWGRVVTDKDGTSKRTCVECGMQVEELTF